MACTSGEQQMAMHGVLSTSLRLDSACRTSDAALVEQEHLQYRAANVRYGISRSYLDEWQTAALPCQYLDPLRFLQLPQPSRPPAAGGPPGRVFRRPHGETQRTRHLPRTALVAAAEFVRPGEHHQAGKLYRGLASCSTRHLEAMRARRLVDVAIRPAMSPAELSQLFARRNMVFLPRATIR